MSHIGLDAGSSADHSWDMHRHRWDEGVCQAAQAEAQRRVDTVTVNLRSRAT
ncbi:hypothetical protein RKD05_002518 [Microbacterium sp. SLBN-111]